MKQVRSSRLSQWFNNIAMAAFASLVLVNGTALAQNYKLGKPTDRRQMNLCRDQADILMVAQIFEFAGAKPGFTALSKAPSCYRAVLQVTPVEVTKTVTIGPGTELEYQLYFVAVRTDSGAQEYLVTTRQVQDTR